MEKKTPKFEPFKGVKQLEARKIPGLYSDTQCKGLYLKVSENGSRSWQYRYQLAGRRREMGLGTYPAVTLEMAHSAAADAAVLVGRKVDPIDARKASQQAEKADTVKAKLEGTTLRYAVAEYCETKGATWAPKHREQWALTVLDVFADYADQPVAGITVETVIEALKPRWTTTTETAERVLGRICSIIDRANSQKWRTENAAGWAKHVREILPTIPTKDDRIEHHPALRYIDGPAWWASKRTGKGAAALEFLVLTVGRSGEVRGATAREFDLDAGLWIVPASRMKARKEHIVPLTRQAIDIVRPLLEDLEPDDLVFFSQPGTKLHDMTLTRAIGAGWQDENGEDVTVHGFRSTFIDWVAEETDFDIDTADKCLAHATGSKVRRAYQRGSAVEKRRVILQAWADYLFSHEL